MEEKNDTWGTCFSKSKTCGLPALGYVAPCVVHAEIAIFDDDFEWVKLSESPFSDFNTICCVLPEREPNRASSVFCLH